MIYALPMLIQNLSITAAPPMLTLLTCPIEFNIFQETYKSQIV